jgi:hypothetical protein
MKFTITAFLFATVLLAGCTRSAPIPLSDDLLLDEDLVGSTDSSDDDVELSSDLEDELSRGAPNCDNCGSTGGNAWIQANCCPNGQYGPAGQNKCQSCPAGHGVDKGTQQGKCNNELVSSCQACNSCQVVSGGVCKDKQCPSGKSCKLTRGRNWNAGQCYRTN